MPGLSQWAVRKPVAALISYFVVVIAIIGLGIGFGGTLNDSFDLPDTESTTAQQLLGTIGNEGINAESSGETAKIVWSPSGGTAVDAQSEAVITPLLTDISELSSVGCITNPFDVTAPFGDSCPSAPAGGDDSSAQPPLNSRKNWRQRLRLLRQRTIPSVRIVPLRRRPLHLSAALAMSHRSRPCRSWIRSKRQIQMR